MDSTKPKISIVMPVRNGDAWLNETFRTILSQSRFDQTEIIVIDSGSTDQSLSIIEKYPVRLFTIEHAEFNHGTTRNLGVRNARGEFVVMIVQDAKPIGRQWLEFLLEPFEDDEVMAVCGQQVVPHDADKNPMQWYRPVAGPSVKKYCFSARETFEHLSPVEKRRVCGWDNVNAMYRRDALLKIPFREIDFGEDMQWAKDALESGYCLAHTGFAQVEHYHNNSDSSNYVRQFAEDFQLYKMFGIVPELHGWNGKVVLKDIKWFLTENEVSLADKWRWLRYNHMLRRSSRHSTQHFLNALARGESALEEEYQKLKPSNSQPLKPGMASVR